MLVDVLHVLNELLVASHELLSGFFLVLGFDLCSLADVVHVLCEHGGEVESLWWALVGAFVVVGSFCAAAVFALEGGVVGERV